MSKESEFVMRIFAFILLPLDIALFNNLYESLNGDIPVVMSPKMVVAVEKTYGSYCLDGLAGSGLTNF